MMTKLLITWIMTPEPVVSISHHHSITGSPRHIIAHRHSFTDLLRYTYNLNTVNGLQQAEEEIPLVERTIIQHHSSLTALEGLKALVKRQF